MIAIEKVDFLGIPVRENMSGDAWFGETLRLWERNPRSTERWVEFETPNVTLALVPDAYTPGDYVPLPFGSLAIRVDDVDAERSRLSAAGVELQGETWDSTVCNGAAFTGVDGNGLLLHRRYAPFQDGRSPEAPRGRIDFVAVPVQERAPVEQFYGEVRGSSAIRIPRTAGSSSRPGTSRSRSSRRSRSGSRSHRFPEGRSRSAFPTSRLRRTSSSRRVSSSPPV